MRSVCKSDPVEYGQDSMTECGTHDRMVGVEMIMV